MDNFKQIHTSIGILSSNQVNKIPEKIVGRFLQKLSVADRLKGERVLRRWKYALQKWGWTEQRKLDRDIVFEGANEKQIARFWDKSIASYESNCHLISLFHRCSSWLRELDLHSFGRENSERFISKIAETIALFKGLEMLNIKGYDINHFMDYLPHTLRNLKTSSRISIETLQALSGRCPNLEEVPFHRVFGKNLDVVLGLIEKFARQKRLDFSNFYSSTKKVGALASIGQLKELEELDLWSNWDLLDEETFEAIVEGCQRLRLFKLNTEQLTEKALFQLANMPSLNDLQVLDLSGEFTDAVLKTIAQKGQLKKLQIYGSGSNGQPLTDNAIEYLVDRCKSLVSIAFCNCPMIKEQSLDAVIAKVRKRHGIHPRTLSTDLEYDM